MMRESGNKRPVPLRGVVRLMGGAVLVTALVALGFGREASAVPCPSPGIKCFGGCCGTNQQCVQKGAGASCQCVTGTFFCNGQCVTSTNTNCGFCGNTCTGGATCVNGTCQCPSGDLLCNGECVPSDETNCGFCGNECPTNASCVSGTCQCDAGFVFCGGACVSTTCATGEQFNFSTCDCEPTGGGTGNCTPEGGLCTSKNECCSPTAKCSPSGGRKTCQG